MQYFDLAQLSLAKGAGSSVTEMYIPLWSADGTVASGSTALNAGTNFLQDGSGSSSSSAKVLHTLNASWSSTQKYAFEATIYSSSGYTTYVELWDVTSGTAVASSQVSTLSTTATTLRSGQFTLTPGHNYGVTAWCTNGSVASGWYIVDASLIVFP